MAIARIEESMIKCASVIHITLRVRGVLEKRPLDLPLEGLRALVRSVNLVLPQPSVLLAMYVGVQGKEHKHSSHNITG